MIIFIYYYYCFCFVFYLFLINLFFTRERSTANRTIRRNEKKIKELLAGIDDERKQADMYKSDVRMPSHRHYQYIYQCSFVCV